MTNDLKEENERLERQLRNMVRSYEAVEAEVRKLRDERDGLLDTVERLSLDLAVKDGMVQFQD